ncbi:MAG: rod-binding protein [Thermoguttaceae bacterium]
MRSTLGTPAYFNGGRAEEVFTQQLDQVLGQKLSQTSADQFTAPMYHLFSLGRR